MNIVIAIESFYDGGAEIFAIKLANELAKTQQVYFLELYPYSTKEKRQLHLLDTKRIKLIQPGKNIFSDYLFRKVRNENYYLNNSKTKVSKFYRLLKKVQIKFFIKRYKIEIVNSHSWVSDIYFASIKNELTIKLISTFHGHYELLTSKVLNFDVITKNALMKFDKVVYAAPGHKEILDKFGYPLTKREKIFIGINMPLSAQITSYQQGTCFNIIMVARGIKEKGWEIAILAVLELLKKYPELVKLNLVGEGEYLDYLKMKYNDPAICFAGYKDDVSAAIKDAHIGILPSYYTAESTPIVVIEYLFCGKPVVATNVGAVKEMMMSNDKLAGTCIDLQNGTVNISAVAAEIEKFISNPAMLESLSSIALKAANKFTMKTCLENYLKVYGINE